MYITILALPLLGAITSDLLDRELVITGGQLIEYYYLCFIGPII